MGKPHANKVRGGGIVVVLGVRVKKDVPSYYET